MPLSNYLFVGGLRVDILLWVVGVLIVAATVVLLWWQRREHKKLKRELDLMDGLNKRNVEFEMVLKTMKLSTWKVDVQSQTLTVVSDFRESNSYAPLPETSASDFFRHILPKDVGRVQEALRQMISGEQEEQYVEYQIMAPGEDQPYWSETYAMVGKHDAAGNPLEIIGVSRRIDEQKRIENELTSALRKAEESDRLKSAFLANISHEIRTPLNAIVGFSDVLPMVEDESERHHLVELIQENNGKLLRMINDIVNISKLESGGHPPTMEDFDLNLLLKEVAGRHRRQNKKDVKIIVERPEPTFVIHSDRMRVNEILEQYMLNALKFTEHGVVVLGYRRLPDNKARIWVHDTGKGIPESQIGHIFEHFVKLDQFVPGTGLGLPLCRTIAQSIEAKLGVSSEEGKGSTFWLDMPGVQTEKDAQPHVVAIGRAAVFSPNSVEKDAAIMDAVCRDLRHRGLQVDFFDEDRIEQLPDASIYITMGRRRRVTEMLAEKEREHCIVINSSAAVQLCGKRSLLESKLREAGIPMPTKDISNGACWLKRGDAHVQSAEDILFVESEDQREQALRAFHDRGIQDIVESPHVEGDLVKFYGVMGTVFFRVSYPGDGGQSKLGHERYNGKPHHYAFSQEQLKELAERAAAVCGLTVYGGDAIVRPDGSLVLIDFNDWPSFSSCRKDAGQAIATCVIFKRGQSDV